MKLRYPNLILVLFISLFTQPLFAQIEYIDYDEEKHSLYLAATKLCLEFNYENIFGYKRTKTMNGPEFKNGKEKITVKNCCTKIVPSPFINPFEYYHFIFNNDQRIKRNTTNVFKLKEIRQQLHDEHYEAFNKQVLEIDTNNLISYSISHATIQDYDFSTNQLRISYSVINKKSFKGNSNRLYIPKLGESNQIFHQHYVNMPAEDAKAIYDHYGKASRNTTNPPFRLITKTTYAISLPNKVEFSKSKPFDCIIKKIEFFVKNDNIIQPSSKIGEILLDGTIYFDRYKRRYQKIISNKK